MRTRCGLLAGALALGLIAGACGGNAQATVTARTLRQAAQKTDATESFRFEATVAADAGGEQIEMTMRGVASADGDRAAVTADMSGLGSFEERIVDGVVYIDFSDIPQAAADLPPGKRWVAIDVDELSGIEGGALKSLSEQTAQNTPQQGLESLKALIGPIEELGDDTVGGAPATHYRGQLDLTKLLGDADVPAAASDAFAALGFEAMPVDVWVDARDRVVKMRLVMKGEIEGETFRMEITYEITDFNAQVDVSAPPPDEVVDYHALADSVFV